MEVLSDVRPSGGGDRRRLIMLKAGRSRALGLVLAALTAACATTGVTSSPSGATAAGGSLATLPPRRWPTQTHEHVDLWLHGYAMLSRDTATVPLFERGYRERMQALKARRNAVTMLDANRDRLAARLAANPSLVNGQFVPLYFATFDEMQQVVALFLRAGGDPRATRDPNLQTSFAILAASFPASADRDWLRLFVQSLADERARFYHDYWMTEQAQRAAVRAAVDSLWQGTYVRKLQRYLENTQQASGEFILSLPLDGEGRTLTATKQQNAVTTSFPETPATAIDAIYVFVHEVVSAVTSTAISDNVTPAQQRSGIVAEYTTNGAVRGGALLVQRVAPELATGYMRYYLRSAGAAMPEGDAARAFAARFPLPDAIRDAIARQLDTVLGGI